MKDIRTYPTNIEIPVEVLEADGEYLITSGNSEFHFWFGSGKTLEEAKAQWIKGLKCILEFERIQNIKLSKRAIWQSNGHWIKGEGFHWWFGILGFGLTINRFSNKFVDKQLQYVKEKRYKRKGFWIGRFQFFFRNEWKIKPIKYVHKRTFTEDKQ